MNKQSMLYDKKLFLIGSGSMAEAMVRGLTGSDVMEADRIFVTNRSNKERLSALAEQYRITPVSSLQEAAASGLLADSDVIVLACKPQDVPRVLESIKSDIGEAVILSVAAGISTQLMESILGDNVQTVRVMPNTACAVLESATALAYGRWCTEEAKSLCEEILSVLGTVSVVEENQMDVVTGVSGSGPAYFYYMVEAMQQAAEVMGINPQTARELIQQTLIGAVKMLEETGLEARELRAQVTSPNGATMAGINILEQADFRSLIEQVITRVAERSQEMGEQASLLK